MNFNQAWCQETAHPSYQAKWTAENPSVGQCCVTALVVQDLFGGDIYSCKVGRCSHYFNILPDGATMDLTREQFGNHRVIYTKLQRKNRHQLLRNKDVEYRYKLLKKRLEVM